MMHRPEHPLGPDAPTVDYVGLAFRTLGFAVALGAGLSALVSFTVRTLQQGQPAGGPVDLGSGPAVVLLGGTLAALLTAAIATWRLLAPIQSPYRQGMLAVVSAFGTLVVSLVTLPIDRALGRPGLAAAAVVAFAVAWGVGRTLGRSAPDG